MPLQGHFKNLAAFAFVQIRHNQELDESIVRSRRNESLSPGPVNAVNAADVVVELLKDHSDLLNSRLLQVGQFAYFEGFGVGSQDEKVTLWAETSCSNRLNVLEYGHLAHVANRAAVHVVVVNRLLVIFIQLVIQKVLWGHVAQALPLLMVLLILRFPVGLRVELRLFSSCGIVLLRHVAIHRVVRAMSPAATTLGHRSEVLLVVLVLVVMVNAHTVVVSFVYEFVEVELTADGALVL